MKHIAFLLAGISLLASCTNDQAARSKYAGVTKDITQAEPQNSAHAIQRSDRVYLGNAAVDDSHGDPLPDRVEIASGFVLATADGTLGIDELARKIQRYTQIPVVVELPATPDAALSRQKKIPAAAGAAGVIDDLLNGEAGTPSRRAEARAPLTYRGPLSDFLERQIPAYGFDWDYRGGVIHIAPAVIRSYSVVDMPSTTTISAGLSASGGTQSGASGGAGAAGASAGMTGGGGGQQSTTGGSSTSTAGGGGQNTSTTTSIKGWDDVLTTLTAYAGGKENIYPEPSNGRVGVKCSRYCQGQVAAYIREHNTTVGRSILITVAILTLQKSGSDDYGFSPSVLYNNLPSGYSLSVIGQASAITQAQGGVITGGVINPPKGSSAAKWNGTSLAVQALSQDQEVTGSFQKFCFTGNNRVCSLRNALDYSYFSSIVNTSSTYGNTAGAAVSTVVIGDQMQIIPRLTGGGMIRLQLALSRTALQSTQTVTINGTTTTIPQITDNSSSPQEFNIQDGATLLLSDIGNDNSTRSNSGAGSVYNWLLGGSANASLSRDKTILIVTAREWHAGDPRPQGIVPQ